MNEPGSPSRPAFPPNIAAVTPADGTDAAFSASNIFCGTGGTVTVISEAGQTETVTVPDGCFVPCTCVRVKATGTTASDIVRVW